LFNRFRKSEPKKIEQSLTRTRESVFGRIARLFGGRGEVGEALWESLEELLIQADVGVPTTVALVERLRQRAAKEKLGQAAVQQALQEELRGMLGVPSSKFQVPSSRGQVPSLKPQPATGDRRPETGKLFVILVVGVNGTGKTTSIAKLARYHQQQGRKVLLAAADTFRAAAEEQLTVWGQRVGADVIAHQPGADPGAVVFDALQAAFARKTDVLIIDTAGRLHTKYNLMEELKKIKRVVQKQVPEAPHQVLLVIDATTGQNALVQARQFTQAVEVTGIVLAKLDGTAKGGIAFAIVRELGIPIQFVGTGEKLDDWAEFDTGEFVGTLFA
jgi:fused signal recognition particle receptor